MFAAAALAAWAALAVAGAERPNIVFILVDDVGFNDVGYNNRSEGRQPRVRTPQIDALAEAGVKLRNYYVQPICTPTRAALMTGRYPFRYGVAGSVIRPTAPWGIPLEEAFLPQFFQDAGYATAMFGKWHLGFFTRDHLPGSRGFARHAGLYLGAGDHYSHERMGGYDWRTDARCRAWRGTAAASSCGCGGVHQGGGKALPPLPGLPAGARALSGGEAARGTRSWEPGMQRMAGMVSSVDDAVGEVIAALRATGTLERTILVFSPDNGAPGQTAGAVLPRNWPFRGKKKEVYEGGLRRLCLLAAAAARPGTSVDALVHVTDWLPGGRGIAATGPGAPLAPRWRGPLGLHPRRGQAMPARSS